MTQQEQFEAMLTRIGIPYQTLPDRSGGVEIDINDAFKAIESKAWVGDDRPSMSFIFDGDGRLIQIGAWE